MPNETVFDKMKKITLVNIIIWFIVALVLYVFVLQNDSPIKKKEIELFPIGVMVIIKVSGQRGQVVGYWGDTVKVRYRCDYVEESHGYNGFFTSTTTSQRHGSSYKIDGFDRFELDCEGK